MSLARTTPSFLNSRFPANSTAARRAAWKLAGGETPGTQTIGASHPSRGAGISATPAGVDANGWRIPGVLPPANFQPSLRLAEPNENPGLTENEPFARFE